MPYFTEVVIEQSLNVDSNFDTTGYSSSSTQTCSKTSISEVQGHKFLGYITSGNSIKKTYSNLPQHYLASVRIDFVLVDNWSQDLFNLYFDGKLITEQNYSGGSGYDFCGGGQQDRFYRGYWSMPHTASTLTLQVELQDVSQNSNKYILFRQIQITLDTCDQSCSTCYGSQYTNCLTCPNGGTDGSDRCYCPTNQYASNQQCVGTCPSGQAPDSNGFCQVACTAPQFQFQGYCITPDPSVKTYGLFSNNFSAISIFNMGWKIYNMGQVGVFSDCGSYRLFGGFAIVNKGTYMEIVFANLPKHYNVKIMFKALMIDWDSSTTATLSLDGNVVETLSAPSSGGSQICGSTNSNDYIYTLNKPAYTHSNAQLTVTINTSYSNTDVYTFGFGIREIQIYLDSVINFYQCVCFHFDYQLNIFQIKCPKNCQQCDATGCINCFQGFLLYKGSCYTPCPPKTFPISTIAIPVCQDCYSNCASCSIGNASNNCDTCNTGNYLLLGSCVADCGDYYYADSNNVCQQCDQTCQRCSGPMADNCTKCSSPLYLDKTSNRCVQGPNCPSGTYPEVSNRTCMPCNAVCLTCNGSLSTNCLTCTNYLDVNTCVSQCSVGKYAYSLTKSCKPCDPNCYACNIQATNCIQCSSPNFLDNSKCSPNCSAGKYGDPSDRVCKVCPNNCTNCLSGSASDCTGCSQGYFLTILNTTLISGTCGLSCASGFWTDTTYNQCKPCFSNCATCNPPGTQNSCLTCNTNFYLTVQSSCDAKCPDRFYPDTANLVCKPCHSTCLQCTNSSNQNCTKCDTGRYLLLLTAKEGSCYINCPDSYYNDGVSNTCLSCFGGCRTCSGPLSNQCAACMPGTYLLKNTCLTSCPVHYVPNEASQTCVECPKECATCLVSDPTKCTKCQTGWYLLDMQCLQRCPSTYYTDYDTQTCQPCCQNCEICTGPNPQDCSVWFRQSISLLNLLIFWIFVGKSAYCALVFLLGYYLDSKFKPKGPRIPFKDPRVILPYTKIAPLPQIGASGNEVANRRGRNGTLNPNTIQQNPNGQNPEDQDFQKPPNLFAKSPGLLNDDENADDQFNSPNKLGKNKKKAFNPNTPKNPQDDEEDDNEGSGDDQSPNQQNPNGEDEDDDGDDEDQVQPRNALDTQKSEKSNGNPENTNDPNKPQKKGLKFLRKVILRHGTLMKLRGDIRKKTDKEVLDLIIPKGEETENKKKKIGADGMVIETIDMVEGDDNDPNENMPKAFQRKKSKQGTSNFDNISQNNKNKLRINKKKNSTIPMIGGGEHNDEDDEDQDDYGHLNRNPRNGSRLGNQNKNDGTQTTIFNPHANGTMILNQTTNTRPATATSGISDNKDLLQNQPTLGILAEKERSNKANLKFPNGVGYFRTLLEFYELTTIFMHYDYDLERPLRALIFFSKLLFIFCITRPYDNDVPLVGIILCMFGLKIVMNCLERIMTKISRFFDKLLFIFFASAVIYCLFNTFYLFLPALVWVSHAQDWSWSLKYLITFGVDLLFFQIGYFTIQFYVTKHITFCHFLSLPMRLLGYLFFKENISQFISV
ncbi:hypothetical protein ABPG73_011882 [Tetrahymena malaccensis]